MILRGPSSLMLFPVLLFMLALQQPAAAQHEAQTYKTLSYWVTLKECDTDISMVYLTVLDEEKLRRVVDKKLIILQWSYDIKGHVDKDSFFIMDLLAQFGQKIYRIEVMGKNKNGEEFYNVLYLSPVGVSHNLVEKAPMREEYIREWKKSDMQALLTWIAAGHQFFPKGLETKYKLLERRGSLQINVPLIVKGSPDCKVLRSGDI